MPKQWRDKQLFFNFLQLCCLKDCGIYKTSLAILLLTNELLDLKCRSTLSAKTQNESPLARLMWISSLQRASCPEVYMVYFSQHDPHSYPNPCVCGRAEPREPRRHTFALGSPSPGFSLEPRPQQHMSLIKCSLRHWLVNTQLQENQQRAHSSSATL